MQGQQGRKAAVTFVVVFVVATQGQRERKTVVVFVVVLVVATVVAVVFVRSFIGTDAAVGVVRICCSWHCTCCCGTNGCRSA